MQKPGPSPEYRELLEGRITPEEYLQKLKQQVNERLRERPASRREQRRAATA